MNPGPVLAVQERGVHPEVLHTGHAVVLSADGTARTTLGSPAQATYWRSAAKPLQAVAMLRAGARLGGAALAVACGSHAGEAMHREVVQAALDACGCAPADLSCGVHRPWSRHSVRPAGGPDALGNNCSGKHVAMLAACRARGWPTAGYVERDHPVQGAVADVVAAATERAPEGLGWAVDGCGVPTWWLPVTDLATAFRWLPAVPEGVRVLDAMGAHPGMVSGTGQFCTDLAAATRGRVVGKYGALGLYGAVDRRSGEALAVKMDGGDERAAKAVAGSLIVEAGWLSSGEAAALDEHLEVPLRNHAGRDVGRLFVTLPSSLR